MRKQKFIKRVVVVAICLTVFVMWQRQWLSDGKSFEGENTHTNKLSEIDDSNIPIRHDINYPKINDNILLFVENETNVAANIPNVNDVNNREGRVAKVSDQNELLREITKRNINIGKSSKSYRNLFTPERNSRNISVYDNKLQSAIEDKFSTDDDFSEETLKAVMPPQKNRTSSMSELINTPESVTVDGINEDIKFSISSDENDDEISFAKFMSHRKFNRLNGSVYFKNADIESKHQQHTEMNYIKLHNESHPPENVLSEINHTLIKDDRGEFLGQMPQFGDYDLPILQISNKNSGESLPIHENKTQNFISETMQKEESLLDTTEENDLDKIMNETFNMMDDVIILGNVNASKKYAVFSTTTANRNSLSFIFYFPLTVLAWKRIGFDSVVIIVGTKEEWNSDPLLYHVLSTAQQLDCIVIFLEPRPEKSIMISQVARIFAANILHSAFRGIDNIYLVTTDMDIWPIYGDVYMLPAGKSILSLNSDCCEPFRHRGLNYKMLPMANIGMKVRTWCRVTKKFGESPKTIDDILTYFVQEFGTVALKPVHKGDNTGWYLDQMMISILISKWIKDHGSKTVKFVSRDVGIDRIDRASWSFNENSIEDKVDAHLLHEAYIPGVWVRITHLLREMYGDMSKRYVWCIDYYESFQRLFLEKYRDEHILSPVRDDLHWLPVRHHIDYKLAVLVYQCLNSAGPEYCNLQAFQSHPSRAAHTFARAHHHKLLVPHVRTVRYDQCSFSVSGPTVLNSLQAEIRDPSLSREQFCSNLKTCLFR